MKSQLADYKEKLEQAQNDLSAWKFSPDRSGLNQKLHRLTSNSAVTSNLLTLSLTHLPTDYCGLRSHIVCVLYTNSVYCLFVCIVLHVGCT